ncbi:MAG TPA: hypothetical protein VII36_02310 [Usitatibacter sp.]
MKRAMQMFGSSVLLSLAPLASARDDHDPAALKIAAGFVSFAGSEDNILALARALHEGVPVRIVSATALESSAVPDVVVIEPPTGKMGWNDVKMALMLARDALRRYGISRPTLQQLRAALTGGEAAMPQGKVATFRGVLQMRADGMNWGAIAAERYRRAG